MKSERKSAIGISRGKVDGFGIVTGRSKYTADFPADHAVHIRLLLSPHAHAEIVSIDEQSVLRLPGVLGVLHFGNVPQIPHTTAGQGYPEPSPWDSRIFDRKVRFVGDRVAAVIAESVEIANAACEQLQVEYRILPAILDARTADAQNSPIIHHPDEVSCPVDAGFEPERNIVARIQFEIGDVEAALAAADHVVEGTYRTHRSQISPIEPHVSDAWLDEQGRLVVRTSTQVPFHLRRLLAQTLDIPASRIRVIKPRVGGGFGVKQEMVTEDIAALAALRTGRLARLELTRRESFLLSRCRHAMDFELRSGVNQDGTITAIDMRLLSDTGAYGGHGLTVASNCGNKTLPFYHCDHIRFDAKVVYTNLPPAGANRGYGVPQGAFALESQIDEMAAKIGMDPIEFRQKNHIRLGEGSPVFEILGEGREGFPMTIRSSGLPGCLRAGMKAINWQKLRRQGPGDGLWKRGVGMCALMQGSGIPDVDMGSAFIKLQDDGSFLLAVGATDIGQGSDTILAQIAAEVLEVNSDQVIVQSSDTDLTPFDVGAYASSTTYVSGEAVRQAAVDLKRKILTFVRDCFRLEDKEVRLNQLEYHDGVVDCPHLQKSMNLKDIGCSSFYGPGLVQLAATASHTSKVSPPPFAAQFAEVLVHSRTGQFKLVKFVAAVDCGTLINPLLAEGQVQGAVVNGLGFALSEEYKFQKNGRMLNADFRFYRMFSQKDMPELEVILIPSREPTGPFGAKSAGEIGVSGPLPAIANAIQHAVGVRITDAPITAEKIWRAMQERSRDHA